MMLFKLPFRLAKVMLQLAGVGIFAIMVVLPLYALTMNAYQDMKQAHAAALRRAQQAPVHSQISAVHSRPVFRH